MQITRKSMYSGKENTLDLNITEEQITRYNLGRECVQQIFPKLTASEREFIITGITQSEWNSLFPPELERSSGSMEDEKDAWKSNLKSGDEVYGKDMHIIYRVVRVYINKVTGEEIVIVRDDNNKKHEFDLSFITEKVWQYGDK